MYWMYAYDPDTGDYLSHKGDQGGMSLAFGFGHHCDGVTYNTIGSKPIIGSFMRVGSNYARTRSAQDWWQTTPIVKILEEWIDKENNLNVKFKTESGSYYHWKGPNE